MQTWGNKSIYHSYLVNTQSDPVVKFGKPVPSQYKKDRMTVAVEVQGEDDQTYFLDIENKSIEDVISKNAGRWVRFEATGKGDTARLKLTPVSGAAGVTYAPESVMEQYMTVLEAVSDRFDTGVIGDDGLPTPTAHDVTTTLLIHWGRTGFSVPLYAGQEPDEGVDQGEDTSELTEAVGEYLRGEGALEWSGTSHDGQNLESMLDAIDKLLDDGPSVDRLEALLQWLAAEALHQATAADDSLPF